MAILAICCLWIVTDVAYGVRMWELGVDAWIGRIKALTIILIGVSLSYLFFNYLVNTFLDRNKEKKVLLKDATFQQIENYLSQTTN